VATGGLPWYSWERSPLGRRRARPAWHVSFPGADRVEASLNVPERFALGPGGSGRLSVLSGTSRKRFWGVLAATCLVHGCLARLPVRADDPPAPPAPRPTDRAADDTAVNLFLNTPADLDALWKALAKPDFVILRGDEYARLRRAGQERASRPSPWASVVESVSVQGVARDDQASLTVELGITLASDGPVWVPIRLDGLTLASAREGNRDLAVRTGDGGGRQVELSGRGKHVIRVTVLVAVLLTPEGKQIDVAIPEAAATRVAIDVPRRVVSAHAGTADPVSLTPVRESGLTRLAADLPPRPRLTLVWRVEEESGAPLPPLLVAQGEIEIDVGPGSFRTRSSWAIHSVRGTARNIQLRLDPADEVLDLELDGQPPQVGMDKVGGAPRMTIPLYEPLGPGQGPRKLVLSTRRPIAVSGTTRVAFSGFPLTNAREQAGAIGVTQGGGLWISGTAARGVRQIDPRTELPAELRARPGTVLAYQFSGQPFELELRIEPSPPQVRSEARTTVLLEPGSAWVDTWLDYQTARGRLYELTVSVPPGLEIESVGPAEVVGDWQIGSLSPGTIAGAGVGGLRLLAVRLLPRVQDGGRFGIHVVGRQGLDPAREAKIGLLRPLGVVSGGGRVAVLTDASQTADLNEPGDGSAGGGEFRPAAQAPPADWPWPSGKAPVTAPMLWLRYVQDQGELPLRVSTHRRAVTHATNLQVRVGARKVDVQQETECSVRFGALDHLDVAVPAALEGRWDLEGPGVASRTDLGRNEGGGRTWRLTFAGEVNRTARLRFHYHLSLGSTPAPDRPVDVAVPWIRPVGSAPAPGPLRATVTTEAGLGLAISSEAWQLATDLSAPPAPAGEAEGSAERLVRSASEAEVAALDLRVSAWALAALPGVVVPRLGLRTVQTPEGDLRTSAWLGVETHDGWFSFALPPGGEPQRVRVAGQVIGQIEQLARGGGFRVALPARPQDGSPILVELDYVVPAARARAAWAPFGLLDGGVVQQTFWEVKLPWSRALVGVPSGWSDENEWYWDTYVWKRRPWRRTADLVSWVSGTPTPSTSAARPDPDDPRGDYHAYLFGRPGRPAELPVTVVARAGLVAIGSGSALAVGGFLILVWRPSLRLVWMAALVLGLSVAALLHPSVTLLALQSSMIGLLLTALLALMQQVVERRRGAATVFSQPGAAGASLGPGSTFNRTVGVGSDDSTAIRVRPVATSTMDFASPQSPPASTAPPGPMSVPDPARAPAGVTGRSSRSERVGQGEASP
jgi:hypothetical protein